MVYDYGSPTEFLSDLLAYYKSTSSFSLRARTAKVGACSQALVSQILKGKRQLNKLNLSAMAEVFKLTQLECEYIENKLGPSLRRHDQIPCDTSVNPRPSPKNHLLTDWLNPYVKDLISLRDFSPEPKKLMALLGGIASAEKIGRSVEFLLREGFWRVTPAGKIVPEDPAVITTNGIASEKIRRFHKKALEIALRGLEAYPVNERKATTVLISVDHEHADELRSLVDSFQQRLLEFIERHPNGCDTLMQVAIHLTPIGRAK